MKISDEQILKLKGELNRCGLDYHLLYDDILDHLCCMIEKEMFLGNSFNDAMKKSFDEFPKTKIIEIQSLTLKVLKMERHYSLKESAIYSMQFVSLCIMGLILNNTFKLPYFISNFLLWGNLIAMFILLAVGWVKEFPLWSIPAIGFCILLSLYLTNVSIPSLSGKSVLGLWGIIPLILTIFVSVLIKPSLRPLNKIFDRIKDEYSIILFIFYGFLPIFILFLFDEIYDSSKLIIIIIPYIIITSGGFFYFFNRKKFLRSISLILGISVSIIVSIYFTI
jgi:hypothetical protein